jgi:hypothetical protein
MIVTTATCVSCESPPRTADDLPEQLRDTALVTVGDMKQAVPDGGVYGWSPGLAAIYGDTPVSEAHLARLIQDAIRDRLAEKGYSIGDTNTDLIVGYALVMENAVSDAAISQLSGLQPGLVGSNSYEKGTLIIDITSASRRRSIWRGAVQANVDFDLPDDVRQERLSRAVAMLLAELPPRRP